MKRVAFTFISVLNIALVGCGVGSGDGGGGAINSGSVNDGLPTAARSNTNGELSGYIWL